MRTIHHPICRDLSYRLAQLAKDIDVRRCHWISTPDGDPGTEWCPSCGRAMVRHLRKREKNRRRRDDYILDGGWRTEHDGPVFCAGCGAILDGSLTDYGAVSEIEHYSSYPPRPGNAFDAHHLCEALSTLEYTSEDRAGVAQEAISIATLFLEQSSLSEPKE